LFVVSTNPAEFGLEPSVSLIWFRWAGLAGSLRMIFHTNSARIGLRYNHDLSIILLEKGLLVFLKIHVVLDVQRSATVSNDRLL
jgi:hypothetical protein